MKLLNQIRTEAAQWGIIVEEIQDGVELIAPNGMQFDDELHGLVSSIQDPEPMPNVYRRALRDLREYGPRMQKCPPGCDCMWDEQNTPAGLSE